MDFPNAKSGSMAAVLPDDPLVEILSRVPVKSLCRSKCVSKAWRDLIADPLHRKKLPQTLEGFFFCSFRCCNDEIRSGDGVGGVRVHGGGDGGSFVDLVGRPAPLVNPSFSFLAELPGIEYISILHSCNGLLLLRHGRTLPQGYVVCNPATEEWVAVPSPGWSSDDPPGVGDEEDFSDTFLIFDPVVSPHFRLLQFVPKLRLRTYSSETGVWTDRTGERRRLEKGGGNGQLGSFSSIAPLGSAYVNGMLHLIVHHGQKDETLIAAVNWEGKTCRVISWPRPSSHVFHWPMPAYVGQSQGCLFCMGDFIEDNSMKINIWVLEDYDKEEWVKKHTLSYSHLFGISRWQPGFDYNVVAIHPDRNLVFIVVRRQRLISYNMESKEVQALCTFGHGYEDMTPYVPYFSDSPVLSNKN